jgi:predicted nuclease of predicted toxin-antitoxin system
MKFLVDAQMPPRLAVWLRARGHDAVALREVGLRDAADPDIWQRATSRGEIIVTKDEDFAEMTGRLATGAQVLWVRTGNLLTRVLLARFEVAWPEAEPLLASGVRLVELR